MPEAIKYPGNIKTDYERLCAVYSLVEQIRLEYNRVSADFASRLTLDPAKNSILRAKFKAYSKLVDSVFKAVLNDQNILKLNIRRATYTEAELRGMSQKDRITLDELLYGDKEILKLQPTRATCQFLDNLKAVDPNSLDVSPLTPDPPEDYTGFSNIENDDGYLTIAANKIDWDTPHYPTYDLWVCDDKGSGHFDGDYEHLVETMLTTDNNGYYIWIWGLSNNVANHADHVSSYSCHNSHWYPGPRLYLEEINSGASTKDFWAAAAEDVLYYCTCKRDEGVGSYGTIYNYICTIAHYGESGSVLEDTLSVTLTINPMPDWQYLYGYNDNNTVNQSVGYNQNLDLQEGGVTHNLAGISAGVASVSALATCDWALKATSAGIASVSGLAKVTHKLVGASAGVASVVGELTVVGIQYLAGVINGVASVVGSLSATWKLSGLTAGICQVSGLAKVTRTMAGAVTGIASVTGVPSIVRRISGTVAGVCQVSGLSKVTHKMIAISSGISTVTGSLVSTLSLSGISAGVASVTGTLFERGRMLSIIVITSMHRKIRTITS